MRRDPIHVLVTALGGDLGQAIVKALRLAPAFVLHGCDAGPDCVGRAFVNSFHIVPSAAAPQYMDAIDRICRNEDIAAVIPASEAEINVLSRLGSPPRLQSGALVVCQPSVWLDTYADKLSCMRALEGHVPLVPFADATDDQEIERLIDKTGFPVVVKARRSSGSRCLHLARNNYDLKRCITQCSPAVIQAFINDDGGEYSIGVFACDLFTESIAFRRDLGMVGCSWTAETSADPSVLDYALQFARVSRLRGSANVQVRKSHEHVFLLEVNPRFSSLVAARAVSGFRDVEWSLAQALDLDVPPPPRTYRQIRFRRFFHEVVDLGEGYKGIAEWRLEEQHAPKRSRLE